jgi:16S rRNA (guanine527-N7)-methyltransferase
MPPGLHLIAKYFPDLSKKQTEQFIKLWPIYQDWNAKINVISRKDIEELYLKHVLHSLGITKVIEFKAGTKILDVGTGGGFPGIPLAIMFPESTFHLVDSINKKIRVVEEVVKELGLTNVSFEHNRAEKVNMKFDYVVSRAVTRMKPFCQWVQQKFNGNSQSGIYYLKGGDLMEEMNEVRYGWREHSLSDFFEEEFFETKKVVFVKIP